MRIEILGVPIDAVTRAEASARAAALLAEPRGHLVTTPNPEMLVLASKDERFKAVMRRADLAVPDGAGLLFAARVRGSALPERVSGVDLMRDLCAHAAAKGLSVFLLGGERGRVAERAAEVLKAENPGLRVAGALAGGKILLDPDGTPRLDPGVVTSIVAAAPDLLFVAFGHGKQERWIAEHLPAMPSVRLAMGVGGSFDLIAGDVRRAPAFLRAAGLEWLWRLIIEPWRWRRIFTAVVVFPYLVFTSER
jgi:N-acetylglucosaminyldiphosphoundecaprenol N-acetyl-beta-D-mannosaminyltransferase